MKPSEATSSQPGRCDAPLAVGAAAAPDPGSHGAQSQWAAPFDKPRRSVFGNYSARCGDPPACAAEPAAALFDNASVDKIASAPGGETLQSAIDSAIARAFLYRFFAQAFADPTAAEWRAWTAPGHVQMVQTALRVLAPLAPALAGTAESCLAQLRADGFEEFLSTYLAVFGHAARGRCPLNEIEYGDLKADPLYQPHRLADLAGFYRAFGLEVAEDAGERHDHICLELEFLCVLAAKEAYALEHQADPKDLAVCRAAQRLFLREHLGRWVPAFARRLSRLAGGGALGALADLVGSFVAAECARAGVTPGSEDLLLRPVNAAAESMCDSCNLAALPPGAAASVSP